MSIITEFFSLLSQQHTGVSLDILEEMILMSNIEIENMDLSNNDISNFPIILIILILENSKYKMDNKPKYIPGMVRKVVVTSTTSYILTPTMETSNRMIRYFRDKKNHFLRV
ncbi:unnamed protein product [Rhizophagus irregularis]|nr:unnamed protein product [Rhizophagus irregularis]